MWLLRYYKYYSARRLVFDLCLIVAILGFSFYYRSTMVDFVTGMVKTEVSKLKTSDKPYIHDAPKKISSDVIVSPRIPKSCFSSDARGCVCYDQHTTVIKDFPVDRCRDIVNGFSRF